MNTQSITPAQLKKIQTMFSKIGFEPDDKKAMIMRLTDGRSSSTKDITLNEAKRLINHLVGVVEPESSAKRKSNEDAANREIKAIYRLSYDIGMCYGETQEDKRMNCAKINKFCRERGTVKKNITEMTLPELRKTHKQFEAILQNSLDNSVKQLVKKTINLKVILK